MDGLPEVVTEILKSALKCGKARWAVPLVTVATRLPAPPRPPTELQYPPRPNRSSGLLTEPYTRALLAHSRTCRWCMSGRVVRSAGLANIIIIAKE